LSVNITQREPCRYLVVKYVDDEVKDEPINIGIILQSKKDFKISSKFVTDYQKLRYRVGNCSMVKLILESIVDEISKSKEKDILKKIETKYTGKLRFSEYRGTLAKSLDKEVDSLYNRYVSIAEILERSKIIRLPYIKKHVWNFVSPSGNVSRNQLIDGKKSKFRYDFVFGNKDRILQSISFDAQDSLRKTKLFDWNVMDAIMKNGLVEDNFGAIISKPSKINPKYDKVSEQYEEGLSILESKDYELIHFDETNRWQKQIQKIH